MNNLPQASSTSASSACPAAALSNQADDHDYLAAKQKADAIREEQVRLAGNTVTAKLETPEARALQQVADMAGPAATTDE